MTQKIILGHSLYKQNNIARDRTCFIIRIDTGFKSQCATLCGRNIHPAKYVKE